METAEIPDVSHSEGSSGSDMSDDARDSTLERDELQDVKYIKIC